MALTYTGLSDASSAGVLKTLWTDEIKTQFEEAPIAAGLFQDMSGLLEDGANTARIPIVKNFSLGMSDVAEDDLHRVDSETAQMSYVAVALDAAKEKTVNFGGVWDKVYNELFRAEITKKLVNCAVSNYETVLLAAAATASANTAIDLTGDLWNTTVYPSDNDIIKKLTEARKQFKVHNVPEQGRFWIIDPVLEQRLFGVFASSDFAGNSLYPWVTGRIPTLLGYPVFVTNRLPTTSFSGDDVTINMLCSTYAMSEINKGFDLLLSPRSSHVNMNGITLEHYYGVDSLPDDGTNNYGIAKLYVTA